MSSRCLFPLSLFVLGLSLNSPFVSSSDVAVTVSISNGTSIDVTGGLQLNVYDDAKCTNLMVRSCQPQNFCTGTYSGPDTEWTFTTLHADPATNQVITTSYYDHQCKVPIASTDPNRPSPERDPASCYQLANGKWASWSSCPAPNQQVGGGSDASVAFVIFPNSLTCELTLETSAVYYLQGGLCVGNQFYSESDAGSAKIEDAAAIFATNSTSATQNVYADAQCQVLYTTESHTMNECYTTAGSVGSKTSFMYQDGAYQTPGTTTQMATATRAQPSSKDQHSAAISIHAHKWAITIMGVMATVALTMGIN